MNVYAISDLHLPGGEAKPMNVFGAHWDNHFERIQSDWLARVRPDDVVLIPGDISWAMRLSDAKQDLETIGMLPGQKVLLRGNHDYWWSSIGRVRTALPRGVFALQNDALQFGNLVVCGSRGWLCPGTSPLQAEDIRIYSRELIRLQLSLECARQKIGKQSGLWLVAMLHFPPFADRTQETEVTKLLTQYNVHDAVYGHLHGTSLPNAFTGEKDGVRYHLVSCDKLDFMLYPLSEHGR